MKPPYIIAEIGLNHGGDIVVASDMAHAAVGAGANACKFQYVKADRIVSRGAKTYFYQEGVPFATQHAFFQSSDALERDDYDFLARECKYLGVDFLCTVFDVESVHWIAPLVPAFKVASADITNIPLLEAIASYRKPVYLSTGAATQAEVDNACRILVVGDGVCSDQLRGVPDPWITVLHCVLSYPTPVDHAQLGMIPKLRRRAFQEGVGYSDHTLFNLDVLTTAWLLGATVIEKHFTLDKTMPGNDHYHSMDPADLWCLVAKFKELQAMIGDGEKRVLPIEEAARLNARQSWHATQDLDAGQCLTADMVTLKRPGAGCPPSMNLVGKVLARAVRADEPITIEHLAVAVPA